MDGIRPYSWDSFLELQTSDFHIEMCSPPTNCGQIKGNPINWRLLSIWCVKSEILDMEPTSLRYVTYLPVNAKKNQKVRRVYSLSGWSCLLTCTFYLLIYEVLHIITLTLEFRFVICLMLLDMNSSWCSFCLPKAIAPLVITRGWVPERWSSAVYKNNQHIKIFMQTQSINNISIIFFT